MPNDRARIKDRFVMGREWDLIFKPENPSKVYRIYAYHFEGPGGSRSPMSVSIEEGRFVPDRDTGEIVHDAEHFRVKTSKHSEWEVRKSLVFLDPDLTEQVLTVLVEAYKEFIAPQEEG